jgi:thymidylate synthase
MYVPDNSVNTIKEAQIDILELILDEGKEVENLLEINNISASILHPLRDSEKLFEHVTKIAEKHMDQMMLKPNPKLPKTHYGRLHEWVEMDEDIEGNLYKRYYDQITEVIARLKENPFSKRCVLTLWQPQDISDPYALSWTMSQLMIRDGKLIMTNFFRGNDIYNAFLFNMFGIAKLQAEIAEKLGVEAGEFIVHIGSAHIYKTHIKEIEEYIEVD